MVKDKNPYLLLILALTVGLLFHGTSVFTTLEGTYDFYVHMFFGDHYARSWFNPWEPRWYTGFNLTSYPPLAHQLIALFSMIGGLKFGAYTLAFGIIVLYISGAYRTAKLVTSNDTAAGFAALVAVFLPSVVEAFHVFGQLPTMLGISWLLHALPEIYLWVRFGKKRYLVNSLSIIAVAVCSHHVTPIFGMVFFVLPLIGTAVMDGAREEAGNFSRITFPIFFKYIKKYFLRVVVFGGLVIFITLIVILPYWLWSKSDPITQVPIPHGSRDNFIEVFSSGLVFFIIPWGFLLVLLPYILYRYFSKRNLFIGLSFSLLTILGTGGTIPIPKMLLGENAFNILTLERFTFWATIWAMPLAGEFIWSFFNGPIKNRILRNNSGTVYNFLTGVMVTAIFCSAGLTLNLGAFRPMQPKPVDIDPLINFINTDKHDKWRYLTLGFGDQMAWLSSNTTAKTIDGNYHSARRIPELTTRTIERLENAKYKGHDGISTLQQFLSNPDKYHLKYIFSNDKFYDPILFFNGWHRVKKLDNGIMVWEREDVSPLPSIMPQKDIPTYQKIMWGVIPLSCLALALFFNIQLHWLNHIARKQKQRDSYHNPETTKEEVNKPMYLVSKYWFIFMVIISGFAIYKLYYYKKEQNSPEKAIITYYDALDFKLFEKAFGLLAPHKEYSMEQFMLENSVTDGIVESYGKIDEIDTEVSFLNDSTAVVNVSLSYITPLKAYHKQERHTTINKQGKWYIEPRPLQYSMPANQFVTDNYTDFLNQGRKRVTVEETFHTDIVDRPVLRVLQANLIKQDTSYFVVGMLQNVDSYPADITLKATLLSDGGALLASSSEGTLIKHKLLPKEVTAFKVEFDPLSWETDLADTIPCDFGLETLASVTTQDLYKAVAITNINPSFPEIKGQLFNQGTLMVTIPQLLVGIFDEEGSITNLSQYIVENSIAPRRPGNFSFALQGYDSLETIKKGSDKILVNGLDNEFISRKYDAGMSGALDVMEMKEDGKTIFFMLDVNNYIGNPGKF